MNQPDKTYTCHSGGNIELQKKFSQLVGSLANILRVEFDMHFVPVLHALAVKPVKGDWRLRVSDHAGADRGKLNRWALKMAGSPQ